MNVFNIDKFADDQDKETLPTDEENEELCEHSDGFECGHCIDCGEYVEGWLGQYEHDGD